MVSLILTIWCVFELVWLKLRSARFDGTDSIKSWSLFLSSLSLTYGKHKKKLFEHFVRYATRPEDTIFVV